MSDFLGKAIADFHGGNREELKISINGEQDDPMDLRIFFRNFDHMNGIEQTALNLSKGRILDIGAAAGCHSLHLQNKGEDVTALEISQHACDVMKDLGVQHIIQKDIFDHHHEKYDTLLLLMNGLGMGTTLEGCTKLLTHLTNLLADGGQILADSSDLKYMFEVEEGVYEFDLNDKYYGEVIFELEYKGEKGEPFPWVYISPDALEDICKNLDLSLEFVHYGEHYDYLAKISR